MRSNRNHRSIINMNDASDIAQGDWIDRKVPAALQPYFRLSRVDRPIGVWLLAIPCWWGLGLAFTSVLGATLEEIGKLALLFLMGSFLMRGAGCTWNDILDRDIDAKVARTANRPLASGRLRLRHAAVFLVLLLTLSALILLALNDFTILLAVSSLALVALYPLMKRITYWPQAFLGLTFNWGVLMGYAATTEALDPAVLVLDEPLTGLDPVQRQRMIALFNELAAQGTCLLVSSHVLDEVARLGSNVLVIAQGRLAAAGDYHTLRDQMDDRPHRVRIGTDQPKEIAAALIERSLAEGVAVTATAVEANTTDVDSFGRAIAPLAVELGARLNEVAPLDDDLESVFRYLVERR